MPGNLSPVVQVELWRYEPWRVAIERCKYRLDSLHGPLPCGRDGNIYDRAKKGWLCRDHGKERLCEFCQSEKAWARACQQIGGIASEIWLCQSCAGCQMRPKA